MSGCNDSGSNGRSRFSRNIVSGRVGIEIDCGSKGFLVMGDIGNGEEKKPVMLWIDSAGRKDSRKMVLQRTIKGMKRIRKFKWVR